jgi:hypothetical protein
MASDAETENLFRSIGRLEGKVDALKDDLADLKATIKERHTMRWQTYTALFTGIVATVSSGVMLFHFGIK